MVGKTKETIKLESTDSRGEQLSMTVEGLSAIPFWKSDLAANASLALLSTINEKDFFDDPVASEEVMETLREMELTLLNLRNMSQENYPEGSYEYNLFEEFK